MQIAQIAPLTEAIPPKLYGGTERVISWLTDELVALGYEVVLFASGDSQTSAHLEACWPKALRLDGSVRDPNALYMAMLERICQRARDFDLLPCKILVNIMRGQSPVCAAQTQRHLRVLPQDCAQRARVGIARDDKQGERTRVRITLIW
jgi:hypothetical protein